MTKAGEQPTITQADRLAAAELIATLRKQLENAREALRGAAKAIEQGNLYETMCCSGQDCGCRGSSWADLALHNINEALKGQP